MCTERERERKKDNARAPPFFQQRGVGLVYREARKEREKENSLYTVEKEKKREDDILGNLEIPPACQPTECAHYGAA